MTALGSKQCLAFYGQLIFQPVLKMGTLLARNDLKDGYKLISEQGELK